MTEERLAEVAHHLSTLAAMKMEDIAPLALVLAPDITKRASVALELRDEARSIDALLEAAAYLLSQADQLGSDHKVE